MSGFDAIVVGAGHNGLVAAALLAQRGRSVLVLERSAVPGGLAAREEFHPGYRAPGVLQDDGLVRRPLLAPLALERHGLVWRDAPPELGPGRGEPGLVLSEDVERTAAGIERRHAPDAAPWRAWRAFLERVAPLVAGVLDAPPPPVAHPTPAALLALARTAFGLRRLAEDDMLQLLRALPMAAADWTGEHVADPLLRAQLAAPALPGSFLGPRSAGSALLVLARACLRLTGSASCVGGPAALVDALVACGAAQGVELRCGAPVRSLRVADGAVTGVELEDGEVCGAPLVLAACDPRHTLLELAPRGSLAPSTRADLAGWRGTGNTAALRLALSAAPVFAGRPDESFEVARTASDLDQLERAFDPLKYGELPARPWLDLRVPSLADPALAPPGGHVLTALVHGVPHALADGGWDASARERLLERALAELEACAPGVGATVVGHELLVPPDLEERYGLPGGHLLHGEPALDQLWVQRPALDCSRYATPLAGLALCGSGCHPGGGLTGAPGALAAALVG